MRFADLFIRAPTSERPGVSRPGTVRFYLYSEPELDHAWLMSCAGFEALRLSVASEKLAEVGLRRQLGRHPLRMHSPHLATVFYVPVFEYVSTTLGAVRNCSARPGPPSLLHSHHARMVAAAATLRQSLHWQRCFGCDHVFASSGTDSPDTRLMTRMQPLASLLLCATAGRYKARAGIGCQLAVPYGANPHGVAQYEAAPEAARPLLVSFSGSLDVCCSGQKIRCAVGDVMVAAHDQADVAILASVREDDPERSIGKDTCAAHTLAKLEAATNATYAAGVRRTWVAAFAMPFHVTAAQVAMSQRAGDAMARSVVCLIPAGDTYISSRLYSAIGAGCLPVILGDPILRVAAFASRVNYSSFAVQVVERDFLRHPTELVPWLRRMPAAEVKRRQRALAAARTQILFEVPNGRAAAAHLIELAAEHCFPRMLQCGVKAYSTWKHPASSSSAASTTRTTEASAERARRSSLGILAPRARLAPLHYTPLVAASASGQGCQTSARGGDAHKAVHGTVLKI